MLYVRVAQRDFFRIDFLFVPALRTIAENGKLPLTYDAVVSAVSQPVTAQNVLSIVFVLEWGGE